MSEQGFEPQYSEPGVREYIVRLVGNGTGTPTLGANNNGYNLALSRAGVGDYKITFTETPGRFLGYGAGTFQSATGADLKNFSAVWKDYDATNRVAEVLIFSSAGAATDLSAAQSITLRILFKKTSV